MIMFKLLLIPLFVLVVFGLYKLGEFFFKLADSMEVDAKKKDIDHKADLTDDVERYKLHNSDKMRKADSDSVKEFTEN